MFQNLINKIKGIKTISPAPVALSVTCDENDDDEDDFGAAEWDAALEAAWSKSSDLPMGDAFAGAEV